MDTLINFMELVTMISFVITNRHIYKNKNIHLWIDNITAKSWIISKRCKMKSTRFFWVSNAIRSLMIICLKYKIYFWIQRCVSYCSFYTIRFKENELGTFLTVHFDTVRF